MSGFERMVNDATIAFEMANSVAYVDGLTIETMVVSDCCGEHLDAVQAEFGLCPRCGEHCEAIST